MWSVNKSFWWGIILFIVLLLLMDLHCASAGDCTYRFSETDAKQIVAMYDQLMSCQGLADSQAGLIAEYERRDTLMEQAMTSMENAVANCEKANQRLQQIAQKYQEEMALRAKQYEKEIEAARPKFRDKVEWVGMGTVFGFVIGLLLL